LVELRVMIGLV